jgi:RNA polymerase sigma factor (sigma-70 family)
VIAGKLPAQDPTASQILRRGDRFDRLRDALDKVSPDYRQALILSRIEGLTMKEIAGRMGRSPNSVKHLIARALRELKERFGDTDSFHLENRHLEAGEQRDGK